MFFSHTVTLGLTQGPIFNASGDKKMGCRVRPGMTIAGLELKVSHA
jgi:hypothetical protein